MGTLELVEPEGRTGVIRRKRNNALKPGRNKAPTSSDYQRVICKGKISRLVGGVSKRGNYKCWVKKKVCQT